MGLFKRDHSPYWWLWLERSGQPGIRQSTKIFHTAATPQQTKDNRHLAEQVYHAEMTALARRRYRLPSGTARTFKQQAQWYLEHVTPTHRGAEGEAIRIQQLIHAFGSIALGDLGRTRWSEHVKTRTKEDGVSLNTVGNELTVCKLILASAVGEYLDVHPLAGVKRKKEKLPAKRTITAKEEPRFLKALQREDPELHDLYVVGVGTLLRQENLITLAKPAHRGDRLVLQTKTGPHQVPLTKPSELQKRAAKILKQRMPTSRDGYFFPDWQAHFAAHDSAAHARVGFLRSVQRAAAVARIPWGLRAGGIVWHTATRASGATRLLREYQIDVRTVQLMGGWTSLDQMMEYLGLDQDVFR